MAAGHGGQILLAESTAVLLTGVDLLDLGHCQVNWWTYRPGVVRRFWWKALSQFTFRLLSWSPR
jgi:hypothetical protein